MAVKIILTGAEHPVLRARAKRVSSHGKELRGLLQDLRDTVAAAKGAGLAAPQIGVSLAVCIARVGGDLTPLINPEILWTSEETTLNEEGCLSLPGVWRLVPRAARIILRYSDEKRHEQERKLEGLDARVVQHEVDHLQGKLIVDYQSAPGAATGEAL